MRHTIKLFISFSFLFISFNTTSQCPPGNVILSSQTDVDQYVADYANCTRINGFLSISSSDISDLTGLDKIQDITNNFSIVDVMVSNVNFENLEKIGGSLTLSSNLALKTCKLDNLSTIGGDVTIRSNSVLTDLSLCNLTTINDNLFIYENSLTNLCFDNLKEIGSGFTLTRSSTIESLELNRLISIGGNLSVSNNSILTELRLPNLTTIDANISFVSNSKLRTINFANLLSNNGNIYIDANSELKDVNICNVTSISGYLFINQNTMLSTLCFDNLVTINDFLDINNSNLSSLNSFKNLKSIGSYLRLRNNSALTDCSGLCSLLISDGVGTTVVISNNPSACATEEEIIESCSVLSTSNEITKSFTIYPNPTKGFLTVTQELLNQIYMVSNTQGSILQKGVIKSNKIDLSTLNNGLYYVTILKGNISIVKSVIKI